MKRSIRLLAIVGLIAAIPSIGCFTYYAAAEADTGREAFGISDLLAYPTALLSFAALATGLSAEPPNIRQAALAAIFLLASLALILSHSF
ncbi:hypothetical protein [Methylomonas koyamae]|uniref:hypothetical protein n=1 Tax=Methylomonas koyamae TaxID=702114 RepID=UPI00112E837B|nr:hypothetical protein [Methylomonas koyamae]TPQ29806.1 hypothetical protein C2U68_00435 [Methylomonas koyamae]